MVHLHFINLKKLRDSFSSIPNSVLSYGILKKCSRCTYQRSNEPILIFSKDRGPRIIMYHNQVIVRQGNCVGYENCGRCFEQCDANENSLSCKWNTLK